MNGAEAILLEPVRCLITAAILFGVSGVPSLVLGARPGQILSVSLAGAGGVIGLLGASLTLSGVPSADYQFLWPGPFGSGLLSSDPITAFFFMLLSIAALCVPLYATGYLSGHGSDDSRRRVQLLGGMLLSAMGFVLLTRNGVMLLAAWEVMALSSWLLVTSDYHERAVERAGLVYLVTTHTATMALMVAIALLYQLKHSFLFPVAGSLSADTATGPVILIALLIGFGAKAGFMPLHFWLPGAHANAPTPVSALMSAVMLKIGLYGLVRMVGFFAVPPVWFGWTVLLLGAASALLGITFACVQRDLKRLLAMSSIENVGIIMTALGISYLGMYYQQPVLTVFGIAATLFHTLNHTLFKQLLFLGSGVVIHTCNTRMIDLMGGLARRIPVTTWSMLIGVIAICGLPPLNGFVSEFIIYYAVFGFVPTGPLSPVVLLAPLLAMVGALSVLTFVKLFGVVFLGTPRQQLPPDHGEDPRMAIPLVLLAALCMVVAFSAPWILQMLSRAVIQLSGIPPQKTSAILARIPLDRVLLVNGFVVLVSGLVGVWYLMRTRNAKRSETWGCGYSQVDASMQYSGSSCSATVAELAAVGEVRLSGAIKPDVPFPSSVRIAPHLSERLLDRVLIGSLTRIDRSLTWFRKMQNGQLHLYILYIFVTLTLLMAWGYLW